jgi:hypothetical protein
MHCEGRLPDTALLIVNHDGVHRPIRGEAICAFFVDPATNRARSIQVRGRPQRSWLNGLYAEDIGLNQHLLRTPCTPDNVPKTERKISCQKSQVDPGQNRKNAADGRLLTATVGNRHHM